MLWKLKQYDGYDNSPSIAEILISEVMPNHSLRQSPKIYPKPIHELQNKWQVFRRDGNLCPIYEKRKRAITFHLKHDLKIILSSQNLN